MHIEMKHIEMKNEMELRSPLDMQMSRWRFITYHHHHLSLSLSLSLPDVDGKFMKCRKG